MSTAWAYIYTEPIFTHISCHVALGCCEKQVGDAAKLAECFSSMYNALVPSPAHINCA